MRQLPGLRYSPQMKRPQVAPHQIPRSEIPLIFNARKMGYRFCKKESMLFLVVLAFLRKFEQKAAHGKKIS
jgi:hypothetical protein